MDGAISIRASISNERNVCSSSGTSHVESVAIVTSAIAQSGLIVIVPEEGVERRRRRRGLEPRVRHHVGCPLSAVYSHLLGPIQPTFQPTKIAAIILLERASERPAPKGDKRPKRIAPKAHNSQKQSSILGPLSGILSKGKNRIMDRRPAASAVATGV